MERIDKSRKGMPFRFMTKDEQMLLLEKADIFFYKDDWIPLKGKKVIDDISYWNSDWDELIGEELVGKLCKSDTGIFFKCKYISKHENCYYGEELSYKNAKQVKLSEIKDLIDMEN